MTDLRTAAQQALEALEWHYHQGHSNTLGGMRLKIDEKALRNLKAALAEPVQEPVAWMYSDDHERMLKTETFCTVYSVKVGSPDKGVTDVPLYTAPPQRPAEPVQEPVQHYASIPGTNVRVRLQAEPVEGEKT